MASLETYRESSFVAFCNDALEQLLQDTPGVRNALLATPDGFEIASRTNDSSHSADKLAAVGSSLFALGASLITEFNLDVCRSIIIDSDKGKIYISTISGGEDNKLILLLQSTQNAMLAHILHGSGKIAAHISTRLAELPAN